MESNELPHSEYLRVVARCSWVEPLDDCRHVTEYTCVHQSYKTTIHIITIHVNSSYFFFHTIESNKYTYIELRFLL